ncbi:PWWP domain-containing DNA repair factor 3A isoform X2 [Colius striatus]|uniref:PWWP domain-containing DNA repair factor 3A isoform X2 n=1 Tax=Colius striatus TaxID=57412 RepID=UPI002B1E5235|nr:PWWP domain-containing DNA repair factor 3A isoform X2 [Colius striatus]
MTDPEYVLCTWKKRLWPAKVLHKNGVAGRTPGFNAKKTNFKVEILGLKEQVRVSCEDAVPLKEESIENIACNLGQKNDSREAVEELKYRHSLRIALDILSANGSDRQVSPSEEGPNTCLSQENSAKSLSSTPLRRYHFKEKVEPETSRKKRKQKHNSSLETDTKNQTQKGSLVHLTLQKESGTNVSKHCTGDLSNSSNTGSQNCKGPESKSPPGQKSIRAGLLTESRTGIKSPLKSKEEKCKQGRKRPRGAGSPVLCGNGLSKDGAEPLAEGESPQSPCKSGTEVPARRVNTRSQPKKLLLDSSCKNATSDLEKGISSERESLAKQLGGREEAESLQQLNGQREIGAAVSLYRKKQRRNCPQSPPEPSNHGILSDSFPSPHEEEANKNTSHLVMSKAKQFQLPGFEEDEGLESFDPSSKIVSSESLSHLSALAAEEEEDEELPSILSHQEPQSIEEGTLVWCKMRRYPYWPAVATVLHKLPQHGANPWGKQSFRHRLLQHGSPTGSQVLPANLFLHGLLSVWVPRDLLQRWASHGVTAPLSHPPTAAWDPSCAVKNMKRKCRKACVVFIEGNTNVKKKGFSVSLKNLKHFDCEEKQDLIERAKKDYGREIEWCVRLISDYRIRVGCHSFTGSFLEYFAADISYPVRKECCQGLAQMTFPNTAEGDVEESSSESTPQKPTKKLLPDRTRAARNKANQKIVDFIVKTKGAEEHLLAILKSRKQSRWLKKFLSSREYMTCVETYLEDDDQLDLVVNYLKEVYKEIDAKNLDQISGDGIKFISDVLLPEGERNI